MRPREAQVFIDKVSTAVYIDTIRFLGPRDGGEMKSYSPRPSDIERRWHVVDAHGKVLGRLASQIALILRGKHRPQFTPHADTGDFVVVVNAAKVRLTGKKLHQKVYRHHSGYPGGIRSMTAGQMLQKHPGRVIHLAVRGMLPKNKLGDALVKKLKVYANEQHPHAAQKPVPLHLGGNER